MSDKQKTVLLVDDDEDLILQMQLQFEAAGYNVATANSDKEGRELISEVAPDIAIVDLMMEEHDSGFALCHFIKRHDSSIPIILLTAVTSETGIDFDAVTDEERTWIKADLLLDKPVRFETLQAEVSRLLN